jgi:hypothetical protein
MRSGRAGLALTEGAVSRDSRSGLGYEQERSGRKGSGMRDRSRCGTLDDGQLNLPSGHTELHARGQPDYLV